MRFNPSDEEIRNLEQQAQISGNFTDWIDYLSLRLRRGENVSGEINIRKAFHEIMETANKLGMPIKSPVFDSRGSLEVTTPSILAEFQPPVFGFIYMDHKTSIVIPANWGGPPAKLISEIVSEKYTLKKFYYWNGQTLEGVSPSELASIIEEVMVSDQDVISWRRKHFKFSEIYQMEFVNPDFKLSRETITKLQISLQTQEELKPQPWTRIDYKDQRISFKRNPKDSYQRRRERERRMKLAIFVDLDETLVHTENLDQAYSLFGLAQTRDLVQRQSELKLFRSLVERYDEGDTQPLELIATSCGISFFEVSEEESITGDYKVFVSKLRPQAIHFLSELRKIGDTVNLLTAGMKFFQTKIVTEFGLAPYLDNIFAREDIRNATNNLQPLIIDHEILWVDDLPVGSIGFESKSGALGLREKYYKQGIDDVNKVIEDKNFIMVPMYLGKSNDSKLIEALPEVVRKAEFLRNQK